MEENPGVVVEFSASLMTGGSHFFNPQATRNGAEATGGRKKIQR